MKVRAHAPGRVNLIGDHTDYMGGLVLPMAVDRGTTVTGERGGDVVRLVSADEAGEAVVALDVDEPAAAEPRWARHVAGVVWALRPREGFEGEVATTLPLGVGLSSSTALEVAVALAVGYDGARLELASALQRAEQAATGVPCGLMDQLVIIGGVAGHALLIDCASLETAPVPIPDEVDVVIAHSGQRRELGLSAYAERRAQCEAAEAVVGPLRTASRAEVEAIADPLQRRRARHVVSENERVRDFATALSSGDPETAGALMDESHRSLAEDFDCSTPALDDLVARLRGTPGVLGARLTGAGWGGCVVALARAGATVDGRSVRAVGAASVLRW